MINMFYLKFICHFFKWSHSQNKVQMYQLFLLTDIKCTYQHDEDVDQHDEDVDQHDEDVDRHDEDVGRHDEDVD
nr:hypothetical protein BgiMline_020730 [Biomphalaria glabrata]